MLILTLALLLLGGAGYLAAQQLWAAHQLRLAQAALYDGDYPRALGELSACLRVWPNDAPVHLLLARAHRLAGHKAEAVNHLERCKQAGGDPSLEYLLGAAAAGELTNVEQPLRRFLAAHHPETRLIREALIRGYLLRQRNAEAESLASIWIDEAPDDWQAWLLRAIARSQLASQLVARATAMDPARRDYQRVLELKPDHELALYMVGNAHNLAGQYAEALTYLERYRQQRPADAAGAVELAICLRGLGRLDEACRMLDDWLQKHAGIADVFVIRGQVAMDLNKPGDALEFFRRAAALEPSQAKTHYQLALVLRVLGRTKEAADYEEDWRSNLALTMRLRELERIAASEPDNVAVRHEAGAIALRAGDDATGMQWLASALQLDAKHRPTHGVLADHFQRKGNLQAAAYHRRLAENP